MIPVGLYLTINGIYQIWGACLIFLGVLFTTSRQGTIIETEKKTIKPYYWFLGLKIGKTYSYGELDRIEIKRFHRNTEIGTLAQSYTTTGITYDAWLQTKEGKEYYLFDKKEQTAIYLKLAKYTSELGVRVFDPHNPIT